MRADPATRERHSADASARHRDLSAAFASLGFETQIDAEGRVACLVATSAAAAATLADELVRRDVVALGRAHGILHVALVVGDC